MNHSISKLNTSSPSDSDHFLPRIVLAAAGLSSRMGDIHKLLEVVDGRPLIHHTLQRLHDVLPHCPITVVIGHQSESMTRCIQQLDWSQAFIDIVHHHDFAHGLASSICAGLTHQSDLYSHSLIHLADVPDPSAASLQRLIALSRANPLQIIRPFVYQQPGHPVIVPSLIWQHYAQNREHEHHSFSKWIEHLPNDTLLVTSYDDGLCHDIDTPEMLEAYRQRITQHAS